MTSSDAKQNFGALLEMLDRGPVAIERHKKVKAIVCSPDAFKAREDAGQVLVERRAARAAQMLVDKDRLIKHQRLAVELLLMPRADRAKLIQRARDEVARWRRDRLCSSDYSDRWDDLLNRSVEDLARAMSLEALDWGTALRQNSPWHVVRL